MPFIHEQADWPRFTWDNDALAPVLGVLRYRQGQWVGRMQSLGFEFRQEASLSILTEDVVKSSAIEGEHLHPNEVRSSIARGLGMDVGGLVTSSADVDGVVEMTLDATQYFSKPLTPERLFAWHTALFPRGLSGLRTITVGQWRPEAIGPMQVVSGPHGRETVHFEAPAAERLTHEMAKFLAWFNTPSSTDSVLNAGIAHLWFVTIHPFEDGNGRIARAIADMALARADGQMDRCYSMSAQIESERQDYYRALETQQRSGLDITPWLSWFLACLGRAFDRAELTLESVLHKAKVMDWANRYSLNQRQKRVIYRMLDVSWKGHLNTSKYAKLAKCSNDTALRDIQGLVRVGLLSQNPGGGRSTSYRLAELSMEAPSLSQ